MDRRTVLGLGMTTLAGLSAQGLAEQMNAEGMLSTDPTEIVPLWPGTPPGGEGVNLKARIVERSDNVSTFHDRYVDNIGTPLLAVFRPDKPDGSAVLLAPGGGYVRIVIDKEGEETARRLNASGVTVFMLRYRLPGEGWADGKDVPLQDAQRAMRIIRAGAQQYGVDPHRMGVLGFSAGGHVAASLATRPYDTVYKPVDDIDSEDAKPTFTGLMYPVITMGSGAHIGSRDKLLGSNPSQALIDAYSCEKSVTPETPPGFICFAADDHTVPPMANGMAMYDALHGAKVSAELHVFGEGDHGFGIRLAKGKPASVWPDLLLHWGYSHGWFRDPSAAPA
ncbi:MAG: alpha/beta hydrolase [Alphaproteobacteria bacterium]|nr:alpha/beta hydrolase [Alphaproteobacteria bacterium]MDE2112436.1 alpha/beta hydrolase [Alphaproteobacteria bacterium]MDE2494061.1 alpha/beta hydrolase [Alphaproteobacteria bacterium]